MVPMDTKFGRIYCAISDIRIFLHFQLQPPQNFTDHNETYGISKTIKWGSTKVSQNF